MRWEVRGSPSDNVLDELFGKDSLQEAAIQTIEPLLIN
jgi:hypothetical protein